MSRIAKRRRRQDGRRTGGIRDAFAAHSGAWLRAGAVDLPLITGVDRDQYLQDRARWEARIRQALELAPLYQARFPGPAYRLSELRLSPLGLSLVDGPDGEEVHLGENDFAEKLDR